MGRPLGSRNAEHTESRGLSASARACCRWPPSFSVCSEAEGFFGATTDRFKSGLGRLLGTNDVEKGHADQHAHGGIELANNAASVTDDTSVRPKPIYSADCRWQGSEWCSAGPCAGVGDESPFGRKPA